MKFIFNLSILIGFCLIWCSCDTETVFGSDKEYVYIYSTPSAESSDLYISVNKAGNFYPENPTFSDLIYEDAKITCTNLTNESTIEDFTLDSIGKLHGFISDHVTMFHADIPQDFFTENDIIELKVDIDGETILTQTDEVPWKPEVLDFEVSRSPNLPLSGYDNGFPQDSVVQVSFTLNNTPYKYFRLELFKLHKTSGEWVKSGPAIQQQDESFIKNGITDINPNTPNPVQRYTLREFNNWIFNASALDDNDEIKLVGHYWYHPGIDGNYHDLTERYEIRLTPLKKEVFEVELYALLQYSSDLYTEKKPYPNNLVADPEKCIGTYQITNPIVMMK